VLFLVASGLSSEASGDHSGSKWFSSRSKW
jgi:hypothetical protein